MRYTATQPNATQHNTTNATQHDTTQQNATQHTMVPHMNSLTRNNGTIKRNSPSVFCALFDSFMVPFFWAGVTKAVNSVFLFGGPVILFLLIQFVQNPVLPLYYGNGLINFFIFPSKNDILQSHNSNSISFHFHSRNDLCRCDVGFYNYLCDNHSTILLRFLQGGNASKLPVTKYIIYIIIYILSNIIPL